ncbi:unnamed protein product, partial [Discosporangium mesarthrocarpum]
MERDKQERDRSFGPRVYGIGEAKIPVSLSSGGRGLRREVNSLVDRKSSSLHIQRPTAPPRRIPGPTCSGIGFETRPPTKVGGRAWGTRVDEPPPNAEPKLFVAVRR